MPRKHKYEDKVLTTKEVSETALKGRQLKCQQRKQIWLEQYVKHNCNLTETCNATGIVRGTIYDWCVVDPEFKKAKEEAYITVVNKVESKLQTLIDKGNTAAIIFWLKCKGGYQEKQEIDVKAAVVTKVLDNNPFSAKNNDNENNTLNDVTDF